MTRVGGQPCGCDPAANHVCDEHGRARDTTETEIDGARHRPSGNDSIEDMILVVTGPDADGDIGILGAGGEWSWLPRFVAEDLVDELQRRLKLRG